MWPFNTSAPAGYLPYFLLNASVLAFLHSIVCYISLKYSLKLFAGPRSPPPNATLAHVYAVKNVYSSAIRAYAAYDITNRPLYDLATLTLAGVLWLFLTEIVVYRTIRWRDAAFSLVDSGVGLWWMVHMRGWYLRGE
ncbi:ergosterol biosynthesis protein-like protein Erg28 [Massariosphaeria phaeospora]|uniref:Ergosterol biosynthesis protein-like protein Erg28 n=1 Tax=Massariosphaeria phaeospora TaxID=100035 RepID=A0A7C8II83_9PLEO|nr:ergosterol biosynthesis protein-like protein Erg28 [Massariosphaeria phaeospora]